jgi:3-oxoacyl-[acyl-carrier protein] reductase
MAAARAQQISNHLNYPKGMLHGQVAIVTGTSIAHCNSTRASSDRFVSLGSGQGIGAECARLFANEGAKVVVSDIDGSM